MNKVQASKSKYVKDLSGIYNSLRSIRSDRENPTDISLGDYIEKKYGGLDMASFYADLGLDPTFDTIENLFTLPDISVRFLYPEIIRDALRLGLRRAAIWPTCIAAEQTVPNPTFVQPWLNMSDAAPSLVGEAETISTGSISFGQKTVKLTKMGKGVKIPYEVRQYVAINVVAIFLQDFGIKLGQGLDTLLISCLVNGEQDDGSESAPTVGIQVPATLQYRDLLTVWVRMARIGRKADTIIGGETTAIETLNLREFKEHYYGGPLATLDLKMPIPPKTNYFIHAAVPANQQIILDSNSAVIKCNAQPLLVESEKIISSQEEAAYCSLTTGFSIVYRDARVIMDETLDFASNGFPAYMDVDSFENVVIE